MLAGHLAVGFAGKCIGPKISLGTWTTAALLADLLAFVFMISGWERFRPLPEVASNRFVGEIPFSHSLLVNALWGAMLAAGFYLWRRNRSGATLLFAAVLSHWVLDVVSHRPDMPLVPGTRPLLGFGLWNSVPATVIVEGGLWLAAIVVYVRATRSRNWLSAIVFWLGIALFTVSWLGNITAGIDPDPTRAGVNGLIFFSLIIAWACWMNRARYFKTSSK
jgi:membrane-bound metal-dependent hydrolase YbcI (DUF457 family)